MSLAGVVKSLLAHPMFIAGVIAASIMILLQFRLPGRLRDRLVSPATGRIACLALILSIAGVLLVFSAFYCSTSFFLDHAEASVTCVSWLFATGQTVYHRVDDPAQYSMLYGPMLYAIYGWGLSLLGPSIPAAKIVASICALAGVVLTFTALRASGKDAALIGLLYMLAACSLFGDLVVWVRADAVLLMLSAAALLAATRGPRGFSVAVFALALGLSVNIKIHAGFYLVPTFVLLIQRHGLKPAFAAGAGAVVIALLPFAIFSQISLASYMVWLGQATAHALVLEIFLRNIEVAVFLVTPAAVAWGLLLISDAAAGRLWLRQNIWFIASLIGCMVFVCTLAAKGGAGPWHLLPFVPVCAFLLTGALSQIDPKPLMQTQPRWATGALQAVLVGCLFAGPLGLTQNANALRRIHEFPSQQVVAELQSILRSHAGKTMALAPGSNGDYQFVWFRPILLFGPNPYLIDPVACMDMRHAGMAMPQSTVAAISGKTYDIWVVPRDAEPFSMSSYYKPDVPLFPQPVRDGFAQAYALAESTEHFDVWMRRN